MCAFHFLVMMKLILSLTLIWMLSSTDGALQCLDSKTGYNQDCKSNEHCATAAMIDSSGHRQFSLCVPSSICSETFSFNSGFNTFSAQIHCCGAGICNSYNLPYPEVQSKNGLQCFACKDDQSNVCNRTVQCMGPQNRCMSGRVLSGNHVTKTFGCASENLHQAFRVLVPGQPDFKYCRTSFCNSAWTVKQSVGLVLLGLILLIV